LEAAFYDVSSAHKPRLTVVLPYGDVLQNLKRVAFLCGGRSGLRFSLIQLIAEGSVVCFF
jgi:hypothetical protein